MLKGWQWAGDWEIAPETSLSFDKDAGHIFYLEEVYEQSCRFIPGSNWATGFEDKKPFYWANHVLENLIDIFIDSFF